MDDSLGGKVILTVVMITFTTHALDVIHTPRAPHYHNEVPVVHTERDFTRTISGTTTSSATGTVLSIDSWAE